MEIYIGEQLKIFVESMGLGLIFGAVYDIIRITYILFGVSFGTTCAGEETTAPAKTRRAAYTVVLLGDLLYMSTVTFFFSVFLYHVNDGIFRLYAACPCLGGFWLYHETVGRAVLRVSEAVARCLRLLLHFCIGIPICWIGKAFRTIGVRFTQKVFLPLLGRLRWLGKYRRTKRLQRQIYKWIRLG